MADQTKTIKVDVKNNFRKTADDGKKMNKVVFDTKSAINDVLKSGDAYEKQLKDVNKIVKETPLNVRDMNKQIQAYQSIALSAGRETPVGKEALKKAADLRDRYIDIQNETKRLADDQKNLQGVMQLASTGVAGFGAVQSSMALVGGESEQLRETMTKLMAAQTLLNSINQIATALEKESSAMLLLKSIRTKALTVAQTIYTAVTGKATKATKLFKLALASTGIGLIVIAIGLLIANFDKLLIPMKAVIQGLKNFGDAIGLTNFKQEEAKQASIDRSLAEQKASIQRLKDIDKEIEAIDKHTEAERKLTSVKLRRIELDKAKAKSTQEVIDLEKEATEAKIALNQTEYDDFIGKQKLTLEAHEEEARLLQGVIDRNIKAGRSDHTNEVKLLKARRDIIKKLNNDILNNNFDFYKENQIAREEIEAEGASNVDAIRKESRDKYRAYAQDRLSADRKIEDLKNSLLEDGIEKELEINRDKFRRLREDAKKNTKLTTKERETLIDLRDKQELAQQKVINKKYEDLEQDKQDKAKAIRDKATQDRIKKEDDIYNLELSLMKDKQLAEILLLTKQYDAKFLLAKDNAELEKQLTEQQQIDIKAIEDKFAKEKKDKEKKDNDDAVALKQTELNAKFALITGSLDAINELVGAFTAKDEKNAKKQFKIQKALSLASAVTNTAQAVTASLATANPIPGGRFIEAGIAGTMGLANIVKIASSSFESPDTSGGGGGGGAQSPIASGGQPANFNIVGENNINQLAELQGQPTKAYVVSDDVTTAQAMDRKNI